MRRRPKKRSPELIALQEQFRLEVVFGGDPEARGTLPCWYGAVVDSPFNCEGRIIASHFLKRQRIGNALYALGFEPELIQQAEWDPRLAVPGCSAHDDRWDAHRMPPLTIWRHQVPEMVEVGVEEWGLESALADKCPSISAECTVQGVRST